MMGTYLYRDRGGVGYTGEHKCQNHNWKIFFFVNFTSIRFVKNKIQNIQQIDTPANTLLLQDQLNCVMLMCQGNYKLILRV